MEYNEPVDSLEELARVFDEAFSSTDPRIKEGLSKLMVTMALLREHDPAQRTGPEVGPMERMVKDMQAMTIRMASLERQISYLANSVPQSAYTAAQTRLRDRSSDLRAMDQLRAYQWNWKDYNTTWDADVWKDAMVRSDPDDTK